jgi:hypothetical protein
MTPNEALKLLADRCDQHADECLCIYEGIMRDQGATESEVDDAIGADGFVRAMLVKDKAGKLDMLREWIEIAMRSQFEALISAALRPRQHHHHGSKGNGSLGLLASQFSESG